MTAPLQHPPPPGSADPEGLERARRTWQARAAAHPGAAGDLWIFGYGSLIWRQEFDPAERHLTRVHGWHRALQMWSRVNRGTPERPGLVFALLPGGSCRGVVFRVPRQDAHAVLGAVWAREMPMRVYEPRWLPCATPHGPVPALAFTLSRRSPSWTGPLPPQELRDIFRHARGHYGSTADYARQTLQSLRAHGIEDRALARLLRAAGHDEP